MDSDNFSEIQAKYLGFKFRERQILDNENEFRLVFQPQLSDNGIKARSPACLLNEGQPIQTFVAVSVRNRRLMYGIPGPAVELSDSEDYLTSLRSDYVAIDSTFTQKLIHAVSMEAALAQDNLPPYGDLKTRLASTNDTVRVQARRYLEANFIKYKSDVLSELFDEQQDDGNYVVSLISGLISGIDAAANPPGALSPGQPRDLSAPLPYVAGHEKQLVALNGHSSDPAKQQARRLVSRFPFNSFLNIYSNIMTEAEGHNCDAIAGIDLDSKGIIYSGIFYFYNRLIQQNYNLSSLSESDIENADKIGRMVHAAAKNCLPPELATDAALIDFGRATIYSEDRGKSSRCARREG